VEVPRLGDMFWESGGRGAEMFVMNHPKPELNHLNFI
jgi:hypothetical protein